MGNAAVQLYVAEFLGFGSGNACTRTWVVSAFWLLFSTEKRTGNLFSCIQLFADTMLSERPFHFSITSEMRYSAIFRNTYMPGPTIKEMDPKRVSGSMQVSYRMVDKSVFQRICLPANTLLLLPLRLPIHHYDHTAWHLCNGVKLVSAPTRWQKQIVMWIKKSSET